VTLQQQTFKPTNVVSLRKVLNPRDLALLSQFMEKSGLKDSQQVFSDCTEQLLANIKKVVTYQRLDSVEYKMHNHLENNWNLSNKKALFYNMKAYYENINGDYSKYLPLTFHI
jgi:tubulin monoglycylase TTLL3/8